MAIKTATCPVQPTYTMQSGDYLCLPFLDEKKAAFSKSYFKGIDATAPKDKGASHLALITKIGGKDLVARAGRLDAKFGTPALGMKTLVAESLRDAKSRGCKRLVIAVSSAELCRAAQEGVILGGYEFTKYKSASKKKGDENKPLRTVIVFDAVKAKGLSASLKKDAAVFSYVNFARDILNEPANVINPQTLAAAYVNTGRAAGLKMTVWDEKRLIKERCGGIIGVGQGGKIRPRLVIAEYNPRGAKKHLALVGKGVTFDTGGYCLKSSEGQIGMKMDMGGSAMMFGAICAIAALKLPVRVTLFTPLVENDISSTAYHTTDILTFRNGKTAQIDNTDAEGRLILADALCLASEKKPDWIIDSATLTGACVVALGEDIAGLFSTDDKLAQNILKSGNAQDELFWQLPLHMPYKELLKTDLADSKNIGSRWGGSITAALFLHQFVGENIPWAHLDIAGPGIKETPLAHLGKGAKGFGVKTITELAATLASGK